MQPQDRIGLLVFSGSAHLVSPLVFDKSLIVQDLQHIEPGMVPLDGSWLNWRLSKLCNICVLISLRKIALVRFKIAPRRLWS
ncbi:hypothetical protein THIOSC13_1850003 [uncultured Thiomicrorhabdus sp.]